MDILVTISCVIYFDWVEELFMLSYYYLFDRKARSSGLTGCHGVART